MKNYDMIVIGTGCGAAVTSEALSHGLKVAVADKGPLIGGTCLNLGCIPSKMLIYTADRIVEIQQSAKFGINAEIRNIDFAAIMGRMRKSREESQKHIREEMTITENLDFYEGEAHFTDEFTLDVAGEMIKAELIVIAAGTRPLIPPIKGLETVRYLTNESALEMMELPESLTIIGGGYIAVEFGHFFAAMGTKVTMLEMAERLVLAEEPEISDLLKKKLSERMTVRTGMLVEEVKSSDGGVTTIGRDKATGKEMEFTAKQIMIAVGRKSNADLLHLEKTGVELDARGFIKVNEFFDTTKKNILAIGDINGQQMFTHAANRQAALVADNLMHGSETTMTFPVPHAVYSYPQIASVGLKEADAAQQHEIITGKLSYFDVAKGEAMLENEGFAKVILEKESRKILGFHIIGPQAPELIQEVVNAMSSGGVDEINNGIHIHPALSELIPVAIGSAGEG